MKIIKKKIEELKPSDYNPRKITEETFENLRKSVEKFGYVEPIVWNKRTERVVGGHQRLIALKKLGMKEIEVVEVDLSENEEKALNLALNKIQGEWDTDKLEELINELKKTEEITYTGFNEEEILEITANQLFQPYEFDVEKELKKLKIDKDKVGINKGDVFQLGEHRLLCGDCTKKREWEKLMGNQKATFCFTDPPYKLDYLSSPFKGCKTRIEKGFGYRKNRRYLEVKQAPDYDDWLKLVKKYAHQDFNIMVFEYWKNVILLWQAIEKYWKIQNMVIWYLPKRHQGFGRRHMMFNKYDILLRGATNNGTQLNTQPEEQEIENNYLLSIYAKEGKPPFQRKKGSKYFYKFNDVVVWTRDTEKSSGQNVIFGTKPIPVLIPFIKLLSNFGDIVVDPFGGSGSTLIACEKMKRKCYMMELSPVYTKIIINRWEKETGKKAIKVE